MRITIFASLMIGLAACASAPREMHYFPVDDSAVHGIGWPASPETTRLVYAGELTGERNFRRVDQRKSTATRLLRWVVGLAGRREQIDELVRPQSGTVDATGRILVTDAGQGAVFVFDGTAGLLSVWRQATASEVFRAPVGIVSNENGETWIADAELGYVVRLRADGSPLGAIGRGLLSRPTGLARDPATGHVYVADSASHDIKVFDSAGGLVTTIGQRGTDAGEFNGPTHLSFAGGRLYVSDTLNFRVQILQPDGRPSSSIGRRGLYVGNLVRPKGVTTDRDGNVYVIESYFDHLLVFDHDGRLLLPVGGTGNGAGQFFLPAGIWSDAGDRLFVADMFNGRVVVLDYLGNAL